MDNFKKIVPGEIENAPEVVKEMLGESPYDMDDFEGYDIYYSETGVEVDNLDIPHNAVVLVNGDLTVSNLLDGRPMFFGDYRYIYVAGNLKAKTILIGSYVSVMKNVEAEVFIAESGGDCAGMVFGDFSSEVLIALGHFMEVEGEITSKVIVGSLGLKPTMSKFEKPFLDEIYETEDFFETMVEKAINGEVIFKPEYQKLLD